MKFKAIIILVSVVFMYSCSTDKANKKPNNEVAPTLKNQIVCDTFEITTDMTEKGLSLSLNTDLPDFSEIMVSVSRSYFEKGNDSPFSLEYFSEKSTVGQWRVSKNITLNNATWKSELEDKQKEMAKLNLGFEVDKISEQIDVRMVLPVRQKNPIFGEDNQNLIGKAVKMSGSLKISESEKHIDFSLSISAPVEASSAKKISVGYLSEEDHSYSTVKRKTVSFEIEGKLSNKELEDVLGQCLAAIDKNGFKAITINIYSSKNPSKGKGSIFALGSLVYAPNGKWEDADKNAPFKSNITTNVDNTMGM